MTDTAAAVEGKPDIRRGLLALALATSIASTSATTMIYPVLPVIAGDLRIGDSEIGLVMAVLTMPGILLAPLAGIWADLRGRRWLLIGGLALLALGGVAGALARSFAELLLCRAVQGIGLSAILPLTIILISDLMPEEREIDGQGLKVALDRVAMILLPLIGGALAALSWRASFVAFAAILPLALAALLWMPETGAPRSERLRPYLLRMRQAVQEKRLRIAFVTGFVRFFLDYGLYTYLALALTLHYGASAFLAGWVIAASAGGSILTAMTIGRLHARIAPDRLLVVAFLASGVALAVIGLRPPLWAVAAAAFLFGLGNGLISPLQKNLMTRRTPVALRGGVISVDRLIQQVAKSIAPALMGLLLLVAPLDAVFWVLAGVGVIAALAVARLGSALRGAG